METRLFDESAAAFRGILVGVRDEQLDDPTPCVPLTVAQLVEKAVGHTDWVRAALHGGGGPVEYQPIDPADYLATYDRTIAAMVDELHCDGATTRDVTLAAGLTFSGADVMILAARNVFQYAWDLARATGQRTDFAPDVASELLELSRTRVVPQRGPGGFFGPEFAPPPGATPADQLAGFLGRVF